jgi:hypothetical protein
VREICTLGLMWRELETELWDGLRHPPLAKAAGNGYSPSPKATAPVLDPTSIRSPGIWKTSAFLTPKQPPMFGVDEITDPLYPDHLFII